MGSADLSFDLGASWGKVLEQPLSLLEGSAALGPRNYFSSGVGKISILFELEQAKFTAERSKYTFFILLGDLGGFNGAIMILPAYLMSMYTDSMFKKSMAAETPIRRYASKKKPTKRLPQSVLVGRDCVSEDDVTNMLDQTKLINRLRVSSW